MRLHKKIFSRTNCWKIYFWLVRNQVKTLCVSDARSIILSVPISYRTTCKCLSSQVLEIFFLKVISLNSLKPSRKLLFSLTYGSAVNFHQYYLFLKEVAEDNCCITMKTYHQYCKALKIYLHYIKLVWYISFKHRTHFILLIIKLLPVKLHCNIIQYFC